MKKLILAILLYGITSGASSQDTSKIWYIKKLMEVTSSGKLGLQVAQNLISSFRSSYPTADDDFWDEVLQEMSPDDLVTLIIPIYDKHFTTEEIRGLLTFYDTELGKKLIKKPHTSSGCFVTQLKSFGET
jgi:hypothetical protein